MVLGSVTWVGTDPGFVTPHAGSTLIHLQIIFKYLTHVSSGEQAGNDEGCFSISFHWCGPFQQELNSFCQLSKRD